jgi:hypothetical protein
MHLPKSIVKEIATHTTQESSRFALGAIQLERTETGRPLAVATDGRRLAVCTWAEPSAEKRDASRWPAGGPAADLPGWSALVDTKSLVAAGKNAPTRGPGANALALEEIATDKPLVVRAGATSAAVPQVDGRFPKWRDIFPAQNKPGTVTICLRPDHLADACRLLATVSNGTDSGVCLTIDITTEGSPVIVSAKAIDGAGAVAIMPLCRQGGKPGEWREDMAAGPAWLPGNARAVAPAAEPEPELIPLEIDPIEESAPEPAAPAAEPERLAEAVASGPRFTAYRVRRQPQSAAAAAAAAWAGSPTDEPEPVAEAAEDYQPEPAAVAVAEPEPADDLPSWLRVPAAIARRPAR